jgi:kynurenine formamidase
VRRGTVRGDEGLITEHGEDIVSEKKPRIIDLTHPIHEGMTTFPVHWHPFVEVTQLGRHGIEGRESRKVVLGTHTGTHVDAASHFIPGGQTIDQISLDVLVGPALVLDMTPASPKRCYDIPDLAERLGDERPTRLLLRFDWSDHWGTLPFYTQAPFISEEAAHWLIERGVRLLGMDTPQVDSPDHGRGAVKDSPIHKIMLGQGVSFVEYLTNLRLLSQRWVELVVLPLNILGADGAPCRAIAIER